ncbi:MAG: ABC-F family ATP-binding cassette domain-containing protein [Eggerthellaceae bacterium]|nr:ABC-F family ATP-binding cassette domain-containing protein [Eggerthellaceae bacterium]
MQLRLSSVTYAYPDAAAAVLSDVSVTFPAGWTGVIGDNGCGKTTLALIAAGLIEPDRGGASPRLVAAYCPQDASEEPPGLADLACDWGPEAVAARRALEIDDEWLWRYATLSGGQRKRVQLACALVARPDVLVVDEPTNDLDAPSREAVARALAGFGGVGILISHDRRLLDDLAQRCLVFEGDGPVMRPGGYTEATRLAAADRDARARERERARREVGRLEAEARRRAEEASRTAGRRSARGLDRHDSDGRERLGRAIVSGKDGVAGKLSATMGRRLERAESALAQTRAEGHREARLDGYGATSSARTLIHWEGGRLTAGDFCLTAPELWVGPSDHIVLTGPNGTGKSLLVSHLAMLVREGVAVARLPQQVDASLRAAALGRLGALDPATRGRVLSVVGRLNSDPARLLDGGDVSPGELRKLLLAEQLTRDPALLVLDEPTNHLDVGSIEALQGLLASFPGAFVLVTHDETLRDTVSGVSWRTVSAEGGARLEVG